MLPQIVLDDENFDEIVAKAVKQIPGLCPEWTDYNAHDPGITLLELFAWLKEIQQFHLNWLGDAHIRKYLKLLGACPRGRRPAEAELKLEGITAPFYLPKGSRCFAGNVCFETTEERFLDAAKVVKLVTREGETDVTGENLCHPAFGSHPTAGEILRIGLDAPLVPGQEQKLFLHIFFDAPKKRNPITGENFFPLAEYRLFYRGRKGRSEAVIKSDTTCGLLENGVISFVNEQEMIPEEGGFFWLYLQLERSEYELPPIIEDIGLSRLAVRQIETRIESHDIWAGGKETVRFSSRLALRGECSLFIRGNEGWQDYSDEILRKREEDGCCFTMPELPEGKECLCRFIFYEAKDKDCILIGEGDGMPFQEYHIGFSKLCREGLLLMVETEQGSGCYEDWAACEDFDASGSMDRHFHFEEETGNVSFGDCDHGMAPEGRILLAAAHRSLGAGGNVKAGSICRMEDELQRSGARVRNDRDAAGGEDTETLEQCREAVLLKLGERRRAVTYGDFAGLVKQTPGLMIESVRAVPITEHKKWDGTMEEETVYLVVKPYSKENRPGLSGAYKRNIMRMLEPWRMIGTKIEVLQPEYAGVSVFAEVYAGMGSAVAEERVRAVVREFFDRIRAEFGSRISYSSIYGQIDVLDCVAGIHSLSLDAQGKDIRRSRNGDILLPVNGLAYLKECMIVVMTEDENHAAATGGGR